MTTSKLCKQMAERLVKENLEQQRIEEQRIKDEKEAFLKIENAQPDDFVKKNIRKNRRAKYNING